MFRNKPIARLQVGIKHSDYFLQSLIFKPQSKAFSFCFRFPISSLDMIYEQLNDNVNFQPPTFNYFYNFKSQGEGNCVSNRIEGTKICLWENVFSIYQCRRIFFHAERLCLLTTNDVREIENGKMTGIDFLLIASNFGGNICSFLSPSLVLN